MRNYSSYSIDYRLWRGEGRSIRQCLLALKFIHSIPCAIDQPNAAPSLHSLRYFLFLVFRCSFFCLSPFPILCLIPCRSRIVVRSIHASISSTRRIKSLTPCMPVSSPCEVIVQPSSFMSVFSNAWNIESDRIAPKDFWIESNI